MSGIVDEQVSYMPNLILNLQMHQELKERLSQLSQRVAGLEDQSSTALTNSNSSKELRVSPLKREDFLQLNVNN